MYVYIYIYIHIYKLNNNEKNVIIVTTKLSGTARCTGWY